jgi:hypothetical protein
VKTVLDEREAIAVLGIDEADGIAGAELAFAGNESDPVVMRRTPAS